MSHQNSTTEKVLTSALLERRVVAYLAMILRSKFGTLCWKSAAELGLTGQELTALKGGGEAGKEESHREKSLKQQLPIKGKGPLDSTGSKYNIHCSSLVNTQPLIIPMEIAMVSSSTLNHYLLHHPQLISEDQHQRENGSNSLIMQ